MDDATMFLWGFAGSFAVEVITLYQIFLSPRPAIPLRYRSVSFWIVRFFVAVVAGTLAVAYNIEHALQAMGIGAAAPIIIQAFGQGRRPPGGE